MIAVLFGVVVPARSLQTQAIDINRGKFMYLVQGKGLPPQWLCDVGARPDSQVIYGSFALEDMTGACSGIARTIYFPGSTWTTGRNALYEESSRLQISQGTLAEYIIFMDDEAQLHPVDPNWNPYDLFHAALSNVQPAVATVAMDIQMWRNHCGPVAPCAPDMDAFVTAFHATAASLLLPYSPAFDNESWIYSQGILIELMMGSMPDHVVQFNSVFAINSGHSDYPRDMSGLHKPEGGFSRIATYLRERVNGCLRDRIGNFHISGGAQCHPCQISSQCEVSPECPPSASSPAKRVDYRDIVECKPELMP